MTARSRAIEPSPMPPCLARLRRMACAGLNRAERLARRIAFGSVDHHRIDSQATLPDLEAALARAGFWQLACERLSWAMGAASWLSLACSALLPLASFAAERPGDQTLALLACCLAWSASTRILAGRALIWSEICMGRRRSVARRFHELASKPAFALSLAESRDLSIASRSAPQAPGAIRRL